MKLLLDTQAFIWFVENDWNLPHKGKNAIELPRNTIIISIASLWEMTIKISIGKLKLNFRLEEMFEQISNNGFTLLPILPKHLFQLSNLPMHHNDPFDRLIIAQSKSENMPVVTSDDKFSEYSITRIWKNT